MTTLFLYAIYSTLRVEEKKRKMTLRENKGIRKGKEKDGEGNESCPFTQYFLN